MLVPIDQMGEHFARSPLLRGRILGRQALDPSAEILDGAG
jgi:hypothetical protein